MSGSYVNAAGGGGTPASSQEVKSPHAEMTATELSTYFRKELLYCMWSEIAVRPLTWPEIQKIDLMSSLPVNERSKWEHLKSDKDFVRTLLDELVSQQHVLRELQEDNQEQEDNPAVVQVDLQLQEQEQQEQQELQLLLQKAPHTRRGRSKSPGGRKLKSAVAAAPAVVAPQVDQYIYCKNAVCPISPPQECSSTPARSSITTSPIRTLIETIFHFPVADDSSEDTEKQTEWAQTLGTLPYFIHEGKTEEAEKLFKLKYKVLHERGPVGELPIHYCFLLAGVIETNIELGFKMLERDPTLIATQYEGQDVRKSPYEGENILHIAIINKLGLVVINRLLKAHDGHKLLDGAATGTFFKDPYLQKGSVPPLYGKCYLGEYPLFFAIATNQFDVFDALVAAGANMNQQDSNGNNILHVLVILQNEKAYKKFKETWIKIFFPEYVEGHQIGDKEGKTDKVDPKDPTKTLTLPWLQRNHLDLTPFTLAADRGLKEIFQYLVKEDKKIEWVYGKVTCSVYPLDNGLDNISSGHRGESIKKSAVELIIQKGNMTFFKNDNQTLLDLFERKWTKFAGRKVFQGFVINVLYLLVLAAFCVTRQNSVQREAACTLDSSFSEMCSVSGDSGFVNWSTLGAEALYTSLLLIVIAGAGYVGWAELRKLFAGSLKSYLDQPGTSLSKSVVSLVYFSCIMGFACCHLFGSRGMWLEQLFLAISCPVAFSSLFFYLLAWKSTGPLVIMVVEMLSKDVFRFLSVYAVFLVGFSHAFFVLDSKQVGWFGLTSGLLKLFQTTLGDFELDEAGDGTGTAFVTIFLIVAFVVIVTVLLLNLLIAMMGNTYSEVLEESEQRWAMERARIIYSIENEMSSEERKLSENRYFIVKAEHRFIQTYDIDENVFNEEGKGKVKEKE